MMRCIPEGLSFPALRERRVAAEARFTNLRALYEYTKSEALVAETVRPGFAALVLVEQERTVLRNLGEGEF